MEMINLVMTIIFITEMVIKLIGLGMVTYCSKMENIFDATIVVVSIVEICFS